MFDLFVGHTGVMGQNFLTLVLGLMIAFYYGRLAWRTDKSDPSRLLMAGVALGGLGWALHRGYWWIWRFKLSIGEQAVANQIRESADYLLIVVALIATSYLIHLNRWAKELFGRWAWPASIAAAFCIFIVGALPGVLA